MKNWQLNRRTFLKGVGTAIALPMLDAMVPSMRRMTASAAETATGGAAASAAKAFPQRMAFVYVPNGKNMADWTPAATGADYALPSILEPLAAHRKDFTVISGMMHNQANALGDGGGDHARAAATFLTAHHPKKSAFDLQCGISVDQVAAAKIGDQTRLPSLELTCDQGHTDALCDSGYSCAYQLNLSWKSATQPIIPEVDPQQVFDRLFKTSGNPQKDRLNASILDLVMDDAKSLQGSLGTSDKRKLDEYLSAIRDIERHIQHDGKFDIVVPTAEQAPVIPDEYNYEKHIRLMFDLMALAFQTDSTRVSSFIVAHDGSNRPYPHIGVTDGHHDISHHRNDPAKKALLAKINRFHTTQFAYFLEKLKSIKEGDGTLLDHSMVVYGSAISDGNSHLHTDLPVLLAGGGGGTLKPGSHLRVAKDTPMANLYMSMLDRMGLHEEKFGDSTGRLAELGSV